MEHIAELAASVTAFRDSLVEAGGDPMDATVPFGLHAYVATASARATAEAKEAMDRYVRTRLYARHRPYELLVQ